MNSGGRFGAVTSPLATHTSLSVQRFRDHLRRHRTLAAWLLTLALLLKVIVPSGYMLDTSGGSLSLVVCSGMAPTPATAKPAEAIHVMAHHSGHESKKDGQTAEQPCAFAGLNAASLAAADPIMIALAIAFIVATVFRHVGQKPVRIRAHLRPPLRGPPILL